MKDKAMKQILDKIEKAEKLLVSVTCMIYDLDFTHDISKKKIARKPRAKKQAGRSKKVKSEA